MQLRDLGRIKVISLPEGWVERPLPPPEPLSVRIVHSYQPAGDERLQLRFVYRGRPFSAETGTALQTILAQAPHSLTELERLSVLPVLGQLAESRWFEVTSCQTMDVNGKRVLWAEGQWKQQPFWTGTMFIDVGESGRVVEEVACVADLERYEANQQLFRRVLNSIEWAG